MGIVIDLKERKIMSLSPLPPPASPVSLKMLVLVFTSLQNEMHNIEKARFTGKITSCNFLSQRQIPLNWSNSVILLTSWFRLVYWFCFTCADVYGVGKAG